MSELGQHPLAAKSDKEREDAYYYDPSVAIVFESDYLHLYDCLPPASLAMAAIGQSDLLPFCIRVRVGPWPEFAVNNEWENPLRLLLGRFDCAFAIIYLLPLLALVASFDLLAREKELGTLPLLLSSPVPLSRWLAVCFLVRFAVFLGAVVAAIAAGALVMGFAPSAQSAIPSLALWLALIAAYISFWFALSWFVNARGGSSAANALILAGAWLILAIGLPAAINTAAKQIYPPPSRVEFINSLRQASDESARRGNELLKDYLFDHPGLVKEKQANEGESQTEFYSRLLAVNAATEAAVEPAKRNFAAQKERQLALIGSLRFLSPAMIFQEAANELAGNDQARHRRFLEAADAHRKEVKQFFEPFFLSEAAFDGFGKVPPFHYFDRPFGETASGAGEACFLLFALSLLLVAAGWAPVRNASQGAILNPA